MISANLSEWLSYLKVKLPYSPAQEINIPIFPLSKLLQLIFFMTDYCSLPGCKEMPGSYVQLVWKGIYNKRHSTAVLKEEVSYFCCLWYSSVHWFIQRRGTENIQQRHRKSMKCSKLSLSKNWMLVKKNNIRNHSVPKHKFSNCGNWLSETTGFHCGLGWTAIFTFRFFI